MDLKRNVLRLRRISVKQMDVILRMSCGGFRMIPEDMRPFYRDVHDHLTRVVDLAESYRDLISGSLEAYLSVVSNRLNEIMKVLTIFSAIMLPLTFIAGVYGMNFDNMPELHSRYGYFATLAIMIVVALGMLFFFWRRGWLGKRRAEKHRNSNNGFTSDLRRAALSARLTRRPGLDHRCRQCLCRLPTLRGPPMSLCSSLPLLFFDRVQLDTLLRTKSCDGDGGPDRGVNSRDQIVHHYSETAR